MPRLPKRIAVSADDQAALRELLRGGKQSVRVVQRARILLHFGAGWDAPCIAAAVGWSLAGVHNIRRRYEAEGLQRALFEKQRPGSAPLLDRSQTQRIVALACSPPPTGRARWTVRLLAQEAVKRRLVPRVGRETIRILLLDHDLKPWREKNVVRAAPR
jgi:putative transposase